MEKFHRSNHFTIRYRTIGSGNCIVLLHGYLEDIEIWNCFADELASDFKIVVPDIPNHGRSESTITINSLDQMAESVNELLNHLNISKALIVGHSMGGYVALSFAEQFPEKIEGLCLFHSNPNPDSNEKMQSRLKDIEGVRNGLKELIVKNSVPIRFADQYRNSNNHFISWAEEIALNTSNEGVISALNAMASRPDRNHILKNTSFPTLMIFGEHDNLIPLSVARELEKIHKKTRTVYLTNSGHMGFVEEKDQALKAIRSFAANVFK